MKIIPRGNFVLVRVLPRSERASDGGIVMPETLKRDFEHGVIVALGPGVYAECGKRCPPSDLAVGDKVFLRSDRKDREGRLIGKSMIPLDTEEKLHLVQESDIFAIERDEIAAEC